MSTTQLALTIPALAVVLAIALAGAWLARRFGLGRGAPGGTHIALIESLALDGKRRVHLIQCGDHRLLLATGGGSDILLGTWPVLAEQGR
jgi:flagellar biosynthetic protein FliO